MGRNGKVDIGELVAFKEKLEELADNQDDFIESCAKELAARLLAKVIKRTPVGDYSGESYNCATGQGHQGHKVEGKKGGTLRRGWTVGEIQRVGGTYVIEIVNPVEYASYVEYGHRTANHSGWVEGHFMLTISEQEVQNDAPAMLKRKLVQYLKAIIK